MNKLQNIKFHEQYVVYTSLSVTEVLGLGSSFAVVWLLPDGVLLASANEVPIFFSNTCFKEYPTSDNVGSKAELFEHITSIQCSGGLSPLLPYSDLMNQITFCIKMSNCSYMLEFLTMYNDHFEYFLHCY